MLNDKNTIIFNLKYRKGFLYIGVGERNGNIILL